FTASPRRSTSPNLPRMAARNERAGRSSSAMTTRNLSADRLMRIWRRPPATRFRPFGWASESLQLSPLLAYSKSPAEFPYWCTAATAAPHSRDPRRETGHVEVWTPSRRVRYRRPIKRVRPHGGGQRCEPLRQRDIHLFRA